MADPFANHPPDNMSAPARSAVAITPSDVTDLTDVCRGVYVGGPGNIAAVMLTGEVVTFVGAVAGSVIPVRVKRVNSTNTTATNLVALY